MTSSSNHVAGPKHFIDLYDSLVENFSIATALSGCLPHMDILYKSFSSFSIFRFILVRPLIRRNSSNVGFIGRTFLTVTFWCVVTSFRSSIILNWYRTSLLDRVNLSLWDNDTSGSGACRSQPETVTRRRPRRTYNSMGSPFFKSVIANSSSSSRQFSILSVVHSWNFWK